MHLGIDIIEIDRIEKAIIGSERFKNRIYTTNEILYCEGKKKNKYESYAGLYAAKEAFIKAIGTGLREGSWQEIEIKHNDLGAPYIEVTGVFGAICLTKGVETIHLSISHCKSMAIAEVIIE